MKKILGLISALILVITSTGCSKDEQYEEKIAELEKEIEVVYQQIVEKESQQEIADEEDETAKQESPMLWSDADTQLWEYVIDFSSLEENGWDRGVTNWRKWEGEIGPDLTTPNEAWESPGLLMNAWVAKADFIKWLGTDLWETTLRIDYINEDLAEGYLLNYGLKDDSFAGTDLKITMKKEQEYWFIEAVEERNHCSRNVSENKEMCV